MATIKIRHLIEKPGAKGARRFYWQPSALLQKAGFQTQTLSPDRNLAIAEAESWNAKVDAWREAGLEAAAPPPTVRAGTLADLIRRFKASEEWDELQPKTQKSYSYAFVALEAWAGDAPLPAITRKRVKTLHSSFAWQRNDDGKRVPLHPAKANLLVRALRLLYSFAIDEEIEGVIANPASKPKLTDNSKKGLLWSSAAVTEFAASADALEHWSIGTAVILNEWLGQREGDLITLPISSFRNGTIWVAPSSSLWIEQSKTGAEVDLPVGLVPHLATRLEAELGRARAHKVTPVGGRTVLVCEETGRPWNEHNFRHIFSEIRAHAAGEATKRQQHDLARELAGLQFRFLRHTAVTRLAEANCELAQIAAITGHTLKTVAEIVDRYLVRTGKMARDAFRRRLEAERLDRERK